MYPLYHCFNHKHNRAKNMYNKLNKNYQKPTLRNRLYFQILHGKNASESV